jgi:phosphatidyl-myo-inositol dimannoside synthase
MRVLLLCTDSFGGHGGIALYNRDLAAALALREDVEEVIVIPRVIRAATGTLPAKVTFIEDAARGRAKYMGALLNARRKRPDLVICGHVNLLPIACTFAPHPLLVVYGIEAWKPRNPWTNRLLHRAGEVISISEITRDRFLSWTHYAGRTHILPNAIHAGEFGIRPKRADLVARYGLAGKRVLLTVGRLVAAERYKGFDEVIEVLPELPPDVVYMIAGGGNDAPRLQGKAHACGVANRVIFTGLFDDADKADLYALADAYVMPSRGEGFGYVFLEALASGVPVIGSNQDGGREALLGGRLGLLVDPASAHEIKAAISEVLARPVRVIPEGLEHFHLSRFNERLNAILDLHLGR